MTEGLSTASPSRARRIVLGALRSVVVVVGLLMALLAYAAGMLHVVLMTTLVLGVVWGVLVRIVAAIRRRLTLAPWRRLFDPVWRPARLQAINHVLFWLAAGLTLIWTTPVFLLKAGEYRELAGFVAGATLVNVVLALLPTGRPVRLAWNVLPLLGWMFLGIESLRILAGPTGPTVELEAPFDGEWGIVQGGRSALINHHYPIPAQSHALDLVKLDGGRACVGDANRLESYASFGANLHAPAGGRVVRAVDGKPDVAISQTDEESLVGNHVVIEIGPARHILLAHLQRGSVAVRAGQTVRAGEPIGRCGNSGNTSQPHLHLQVQSHPDFRSRDLRTYPIVFRGARLVRDHAATTGSPRRNDRIMTSE